MIVSELNGVNLYTVDLTKKQVAEKEDSAKLKDVYYCKICVLQDNPKSQFNLSIYGPENIELAEKFKKFEGQKVNIKVLFSEMKNNTYFISKVYDLSLCK